MTSKSRALLFILLALAGATCGHAGQPALDFDNKLITIGTGPEGRTQKAVGIGLCNAVNRERSLTFIRCVAYASPGSIYNMKAVLQGEFSMGIIRSDLVEQSDLRAVMSLFAMPMMVIAKREAGFTDVTQIRGHVINLGNIGSGHRDFSEMLLQTLKLSARDFKAVLSLNSKEASDAFCSGKIDVLVDTQGNPSLRYLQLIRDCDGQIVPLLPETLNQMLIEHPRLQRYTVPGGLYPGYGEPLSTLGGTAVLFANRRVSKEAVHRFVRSVVSQLPALRSTDPAMSAWDASTLFSEGIQVPLHDGVLEFLATRSARSH
jgi:TRAP transporter TAXI family solute receptor